ncbi:MAG: glycosyltransferase [Pirellulaceae bacterium]|nr:glycosyltransferase [Pirellulaceae bacterium]
MPPIRLAFVITELWPGGAERCLANLAMGLDRERFEQVVYSLKVRPPAGKDQLVNQLEAAGVPVRFLELRSPGQILSAVRKLAGHFSAQRPQIVQSFLFHANIVGSAAASRANVPHVALGVRVADPRRWRAWAERWLGRRADKIVCVSQGVADFCRQRGYPSDKLLVIPNGVDVERFANATPIHPTALGLPADRKFFVFIGRLDRQKGLADLLQHLPDTLAANPRHDFVLVGDGPERTSLAGLAAQLKIAERVHFAGWRDDVPAILAGAELLVLPSRWEGMPNVVLEAMAAGKPVAATRAHGVVELFGQGADRQTVAVDQPGTLAAKIGDFLQSPQALSELRQLNRLRAEHEFSLAAMIARYDRLYTALAAGKEGQNFF